MSQIAKMLRADEGFNANPYIDTEGYPTIGTGLRIGPKGASLKNYTFTISASISDMWMQDVAQSYQTKLAVHPVIRPAWIKADDVRKDVLLNMAYQMGTSGLANFSNTLKLVAAGDFQRASLEMLDSTWYKQTPQRAARLSKVMATGDYSAYKAWFSV